MIQARALTKRYEDGVLALDHLDLHVKAGEIYCLLGANGAGKSTAINLCLGFIEPTSGSVSIAGIDVGVDPLGARRCLGYLPEKVALYPTFTGRQNIEFFCRLRGRDGLRKEDYYRVMKELGIPEHSFDHPVRAFSKGMQQKIALAVLLLSDVPVLLLDEPMSGLDPYAASDLVATLIKLRASGKAILMSTHDIFRARSMADHIGIMKSGRKVLEKTSSELQGEDLEHLYLEVMMASERTH